MERHGFAAWTAAVSKHENKNHGNERYLDHHSPPVLI